jgi:hypothetical protein
LLGILAAESFPPPLLHVAVPHAIEMQPAGHERNGFGHRYLHEWEVRALYEALYMALPNF